jgi:hypothetical protein
VARRRLLRPTRAASPNSEGALPARTLTQDSVEETPPATGGTSAAVCVGTATLDSLSDCLYGVAATLHVSCKIPAKQAVHGSQSTVTEDCGSEGRRFDSRQSPSSLNPGFAADSSKPSATANTLNSRGC